jgi:hypothetical protein
MHILISISNVPTTFSPHFDSLQKLTDQIKKIYPNDTVSVYCEYKLATTYNVLPNFSRCLPKGTTKVEIFPIGGQVNKAQVSPNFAQIAQLIATQTVIFLTLSDRNMDIAPEPDIQISSGFGTCKFLGNQSVS